jgi:diacylglycerol O-acyltransferase
MTNYRYERLSRQDNDFLLWESPNLPMHVAGAQILDAGPLRLDHNGIDFDAVKRLTESLLHRIPRYRQKLAWIPGEKQAVWVDDPNFNLDYHFRHTSLPRPGTDEQLKTLMSRLMEQPLDRSRPLWETWVVEGLQNDCFAIVSKIHHCMIDGASGMQLSQLLLSRTPERQIRAAPRFIPRPVPTRRELADEARIRRFMRPISGARQIVDLARQTSDPSGEILRHVRSIAGLGSLKTHPASDTPINGNVGPHRFVEWAAMPLDDIKAVRHALSCTVNDVVLTTVTGAIRKLMQRRQIDPGTLDFRVSTPVNLRKNRSEGEMGNHVSSWIVRLPLDCDEPLEQLERLHEITSELKESDQAGTVETVTQLLNWLPFSTQSMSVGTMNSIVTNVPGPPFPLYMLGAQLRGMIPFAPLIENVGLTIGVLSYDGQVFWGFNADADRLPDLVDFRVGVENAFKRLAEAAGVKLGTAVTPAVKNNRSGPETARVSPVTSLGKAIGGLAAESSQKLHPPSVPRAI